MLPDILKSKNGWLSHGKDYAALPSTVRLSIEQQQNSSERLIGWIQIALLAAFAALYAAAPNTLPSAAEFEPVPFFLVTYFIFTCIRLYLAYTSRLAYWILVLSILVDMALLLGLIWSFHLQYMQPPTFYLKSPTLLYVFIFIALRALRFEPGFVLLSGLIGALGWLLLLGFALISESESSVITRDYIEYLTSNSVLLGAEVDKIISILVVTFVLALVVSRGRRLLIQSILESNTATNLSQFVPAGVAAQIAQSEGPLIETQTETREASILFVDLVSFTSLAEKMEPQKLIETLNEYFQLISKPVEQYNGVINQFQGDAILASFNLPSEDANHAHSALSAALDIQKIMHEHKFSGGIKLSTRSGINTGIVVGGFIGTADRLSYTVYGDDVNIASRLADLNKQRGTQILISERTRQLCENSTFKFTAQGREQLRGRQNTISIFEPHNNQ